MLGLGLSLDLARSRGGGASNPYTSYALAMDYDSASYNVSGTKYPLVTSVPGYTFTRSGIQGAVDNAGAVAFFAANVPAINNRGYHAFGALTNSLLQSQDFTIAATWPAVSNGGTMTRTANAATAPDGTLTADSLVITTAGGVFNFIKQTTAIANAKSTGNLWIKSANGANQLMGFTLVGNVVRTAATCNVTTAWQRFPVLHDGTIDVGGQAMEIGVLNGLGVGVFDNNINVHIWQGELYGGATYPGGGPIIATGAATASMGESLFKQNAKADGTALTDVDALYFATVTPQGALVSQTLLEFNETISGVANRIVLSINATGGYTALVTAAGVAVYSATASAAVRGEKTTIELRRLAGAWRAGKIIAGVLTWFDLGATAAFPTLLTNLASGNSTAGAAPLQGAETIGAIKPGTFDTDAKILAAVAETA